MPVQELPPPFVLFRMVTGYYVSRAIHVAAKLGIADLLAEGARGRDELARATSTHRTRFGGSFDSSPARACSPRRRTGSSR